MVLDTFMCSFPMVNPWGEGHCHHSTGLCTEYREPCTPQSPASISACVGSPTYDWWYCTPCQWCCSVPPPCFSLIKPLPFIFLPLLELCLLPISVPSCPSNTSCSSPCLSTVSSGSECQTWLLNVLETTPPARILRLLLLSEVISELAKCKVFMKQPLHLMGLHAGYTSVQTGSRRLSEQCPRHPFSMVPGAEYWTGHSSCWVLPRLTFP